MKLLYYVGKEHELIPATTTMEAFFKFPFQRKYQCSEELYKNIHLLDSYLCKNAEHLHVREVEILEGFRMKVQSDFIILKCLSKYAIFIDSKTDIIYAVKALSDRFDDFFHKFPVYCSTTLIPFKSVIIYDGFISTHNIFLGPAISESMNEKYLLAKKDKAIVTMLH